jgi:hypothetical protein
MAKVKNSGKQGKEAGRDLLVQLAYINKKTLDGPGGLIQGKNM